jgi:hypothetical protein
MLLESILYISRNVSPTWPRVKGPKNREQRNLLESANFPCGKPVLLLSSCKDIEKDDCHLDNVCDVVDCHEHARADSQCASPWPCKQEWQT